MIRIMERNALASHLVSELIPEFDDPYPVSEYQQRCSRAVHLSLIAEIEHQPAGFKIGYDRFNDGSFYSWMGGVLPKYRNQGVAEALADYQENWAKQRGFSSIKLKTRKKHNRMFNLSLKRGFSIIKEEPAENPMETRIWLEKKL